MRKASITSGIIGLVFLIAAALLAFWITPSFVKQLPASTNTLRSYEGTVQSMVNPVALAKGDFAHALRANLPLTIRREVKVLDTSGGTALVRDSSAAEAGGSPIGGYTAQYAVDRSSLEATASHPSEWNVTPAKGLTINWPIGASKKNYTGWDAYTHTTVTLKYVKQESHAGINTYVYETTVPLAPIKNTQILQNLPKTLPVPVLSTAVKAGFMPSGTLTGIRQAYPNAAQVPLGYLYTATSTYWVAPKTGEVVDLSTKERQIGGVSLPSGKVVPVLPVLADSYKGSPSSVKTAVSDANNNANTINLFGTILPIVAAAVGFVLVVLAVVFWVVAGRRRTA